MSQACLTAQQAVGGSVRHTQLICRRIVKQDLHLKVFAIMRFTSYMIPNRLSM